MRSIKVSSMPASALIKSLLILFRRLGFVARRTAVDEDIGMVGMKPFVVNRVDLQQQKLVGHDACLEAVQFAPIEDRNVVLF